MLDAVYDVTIAYPDTRPDTEADIIRGGLPHQVVVSSGMKDGGLMTHVQVNIHMVRHPVSRLPSTYVGLEKWLEERWRDKVRHTLYCLCLSCSLISFARRLRWTSFTARPLSSAGPCCRFSISCPGG